MGHQYSTRFERLGRFITRYSARVVLVWLGFGAVLAVAFPPLEQVARDHAVTPMPTDTPAMATMLEMGKKFGQEGFDNSVIVVMTSPNGFSPSAQIHYRATVERLRADSAAVRFVQDLIGNPLAQGTPALREQAMSKDGHAWLMMVGLQGQLASPESFVAIQRVRSTIQQSFQESGVTAKVTGPGATCADIANQSVKDLVVIGAIVGLLITTILLMVYRSVFTAALPIVVMAVSIFVTRGVVAAIGTTGALPLSPLASALMTSIMAGACVNYTVFLISRYHERIRAGEEPIDALAHASGSISKVTLAAAATVLIANLAQLTAKLKMIASVGPVIAIAIAIAFLANITLAQAVLALASKRGWGLPRRDLTRRYWHRIGVLVVRRPVLTLMSSLLILATLVGFATQIRFGYDDRAALKNLHTESSEGYQLLDKYFDSNTVIPQFVMVTADKDLRTPQGLADLDQMAQRMSQIPGVSKIIGITRPDGNKLTQATLAWQIGTMGQQLSRAHDKVSDQLQPQADQMMAIAGVVSTMMTEFNDTDLQQLRRAVPQILASAKDFSRKLGDYRPAIRDLSEAARIVAKLNDMAPPMDSIVADTKSAFDAINRASAALDTNPMCTGNPDCEQLRRWLASLAVMDRDGVLADIQRIGSLLRNVSQQDSVSKFSEQLTHAIDRVQPYLNQLPALEAKYSRVNGSLQKLQTMGATPELMRAFGQRARELAAQMRDTTAAMTQAAAFLQTIGHDAAGASASGFYLPTSLLDSPDFATAAARFITTDGKSALYLIQSTINPYSAEAMGVVTALKMVGEQARPNTELAGARIGVGGFPALNADLQTTVSRDLKEIVVVTLIIITVIMCLLLRAVIAPLYLIATVLLTYLATLGAGVLLFQVILGQQIFWAVPTMTFVMIVAVGADYNMLLVSRLREESTKSMRLGTIRTVTVTGSVITSAGMVFAASMFGMMAASIQNVVQMGFIIGFGLLLDTFVVRTLTVPAISVLLGRRIWWPAKG